MKRMTATALAPILMTAIAVGAIGVRVVSTQEQKEVYIPTADLKKLVDKPLPGVDGKHVTILHGAFPAGWVGGRHFHTGPVYVSSKAASPSTSRGSHPRRSPPASSTRSR